MNNQFVPDLIARMQLLEIYVHIVKENTKLCRGSLGAVNISHKNLERREPCALR